MEEKTIKRIPAVPFALMLGAISAIIGLIVGIIWAIGFGALMAGIPGMGAFGAFIGMFAVAMPIIGIIGGFISGFIEGLIFAAIYNFLAPKIDGIKLVFE